MTDDRFKSGEHYFWITLSAKINCTELTSLVKKIEFEYETSTQKKAKYINSIVCNSYLSWISGNCVAFYSTNAKWTAYNKNIKTKKLKFSVITFRNELKWLKNAGYIGIIKGKLSSIKYFSRASRFYPMEKLEIFFDDAWSAFIEYTSAESSIVRDNDGEIIHVDKSDEVIDSDNFIKEYNKKLSKTSFSYTGDVNTYYWDNKSRKSVKVSHAGELRFVPQLTSIYRNDYEHGGRLYSRKVYGMPSYQGLSKKERSTIKIDHKQTVELDYSCLHLNLLYATEGLQMKGDAYSWCDNRKLAKLITLISINSKTRYGALKAIEKQCIERNIQTTESQLNALISKMQIHHSKIKNCFFSGEAPALQLQYLDSILIKNVLKKLYKMGITAIPVHDSIIVQEKRACRVTETMKNEYNKLTGYTIEVK